MPNYINYPSWLHPEIIKGIPITWYSLSYIIVIIICYKFIWYQIKADKLDIKQSDYEKLMFSIVMGAIIGARLTSTLIYDRSGIYYTHPWLIFLPFDRNWNFTGFRGMAIHGGFFGVIIAPLIMTNTKLKNTNIKKYFRKITDYGSLAFSSGYILGRFANFANAELYGRPMKGGIIFPNAEPFKVNQSGVKEFAESVGLEIAPHDLFVNLPRIPSQLIEGLFEGTVTFLLLWFIFRKIKKYDGFLFGVYIILYGLFRFLIEYLREPDKEIGFVITYKKPESILDFSFLNISMGQIFSLILILSGIIWLAWARTRPEKLKK
ncbi:prolipoprotein diacylglyceryl transferase [Borrelia hermsii]|uniref:Phosphatidylglycerol--prolipoprotein diacylglyceryl transferase n=3 Tax=Borrelia hermsii TaxID=140 RepID=A0AAN1CEX6_BORHE|nr:prolipoprotein diacylglyceryl transferase [Borrelia hermsii]AAX16874.1 prolipoprotein diacylglyceryl transferase [Borrelia hermsii DAH]AJW73172.1 diacylglyceryl transferase [Borrelia hermsii CC1]AMR75475.1 Prolipoprotein diacylglyceryl transferase [Borrelia hermsii]ANA43173.1 prolipoprotein diacylglyceryl transferase [Borrelia hermsii HS1]UCP01380.1 prolipoprotein diacylglyceryl transferase [Borrelia hermsii]